jgi:hypothetical protein
MESGPRRRRVEPTDQWEQIELLCGWTEQRDYELIRPLMLFGASAGGRSRETGASSTRTLRHRAARAAAASSARRAVSWGCVFAKLSRIESRPVSSATSSRLWLSRRSPGAPAVQLGPVRPGSPLCPPAMGSMARSMASKGRVSFTLPS